MPPKLKQIRMVPYSTFDFAPFQPGLVYSQRLVQGIGSLYYIILSIEGTMTLQEKTEWAWHWEGYEDFEEFYKLLRMDKEPKQDLAYQVTIGPWTLLQRIMLIINGSNYLLDVSGYHLHLMNQLHGIQLHWSAPTEKGKNLWRLPFVIAFGDQSAWPERFEDLIDTNRIAAIELRVHWPPDLSNVIVNHQDAWFHGSIKCTQVFAQQQG